jgi:hypothetical protein
VVVEAIDSNPRGRSELCSIIASIKTLLQCNPNFEITFTKRQANMAAHHLARAAIYRSGRTYLNSIPPCIARIIINEIS